MINYEKFYRGCGVRQPKKLKAPFLILLSEFEFPRNSFLHFLGYGVNDDTGQVLGIDKENPFLRNVPPQSSICLFHQTDYSEDVDLTGIKVIRETLQKQMLIKKYHRENPNFVKGFIDTAKAKLNLNLCVKNHSLVGAEYTYVHTVTSEYYRLKNYWKSVFNDVAKMALRKERQQFVPVALPDKVPSRSVLMKWENESIESNWKKIGTEERFLVAEFYAWLKGDTNSVFPQEPKCLDNINLIFYHKFFCYVVNLGLLKSWIIPEVGRTEKTQVLSIEDARKFFLVGAYKTTTNAIVVTDNNEIEEEDETINAEFDEDDVPDYSVSNQEDLEEAQEAPRPTKRELNFSNAGTVGGIQTVEELLKIGQEKGAIKKLTIKEQKIADAEIFNNEEQEADDDEEALEALEEMEKEDEVQAEKIEIMKSVGYQSYQSQQLDLTTALEEKADELVSTGKYSSQEIRRFKSIGKRWENIQDPDNKFKTAVEKINITAEDLAVPSEIKLAEKIPGVIDESMLYSSLAVLDKSYIEEILGRHLFSGAVNLQRAGICVTDHKVMRVENAFDGYEIHSFKIIPLEGGESTIKVKLPIVADDGSFMASGIKSKCRRQRMDLPIRKIAYNRVSLTSYVSKFFVTRSEKSAYSQERWLEKQLIAISNERPEVSINFADCYQHDTVAPIKFTILSRLVSKIVIGEYTLNFDASKMSSIYGADLIKAIANSNKNQVVVGKHNKKNTILLMAEDGTIFECSTEKLDDFKDLGSFEKLMGMEANKAPVDMLEVNISGKTLPLVFVLSYYLGFGNLLKTINAQFDRYPKGARISLENEQFAIRFKDETLVFDKDNYLSTIIVGGFKQLHAEVKNYSVYDFDFKEVYGAVLLDLKISARYTRELDLMRDLWVDPITRDVLTQMAEPTDFVDLLLSAAKKLTTDVHDIGRDEKGFRFRGYERFAGFAYSEMVKAVRVHNNKPNKANSKVELNPQAVWMKILQDQTTTPVEDSNPIHSLKEQEVVVYRGEGGQDGRTLNAEARKYHENSLGILSDATVDNGDAGTVVFLTADPKIKSLLGIPDVSGKEARKDLSPTQLMNTSSLLAPAIEYDDGKRRNFTSIQNSRTTNCVGLTLLPVRTGYENVLPYRVSELYAVIAKESGVVKDITKNSIVVNFAKMGEKRYPIGKRFGKWQGKVVPHDLITELKVGEKFREGTPITYNPAFFQYNWITGCLSYKMGVLARVALVENNDTLEDSSALSIELAKKLNTYIIEDRDIFIKFDQEIENLVKVGDEVEYETTLCNMLDTIATASTDKFFTGESREILADLNTLNKKAEAKGRVVAIEAVYVGDPEDMTESLRTIVEKLDREKSQAAKDMGKSRVDGSTTAGMRIEGLVMQLNTCVIRVRIEVLQEMRNGSKVVASHQMKSVSGRVWDEPYETETGQIVDKFFGYQSLQNRIVNSPEIIGSTNNLMIAATQDVIKAFRGK